MRDPRLREGGYTLTREIPGVGTLVFEDYPPGTWLTQKGEPAKIARRRYLLGDRELDSVSSIVGTLDKYALRTWIEKQATIGAVKAERLGELAGVDEEDWTERVRLLNLGATARKEEGSERGTMIHDAMHTLAVEGREPNPTEFPAIGRPWLRGAMAAWLELNPRKVVLAEELVCHPELGYAGRPDLVVEDMAGRIVLIDYKTGKGQVYPEAHFQTRLYAGALLELGVIVDRILIVGISDDGGHELIECAASWGDAEALLRVFKARKQIEASMRAQRAAAKREKAA